MSEIVEVFGIRIDSRCADLLQIVMKFAESGYVDALVGLVVHGTVVPS